MSTNRRIIDADVYVHFITFSVYRRRKLLDHDHAGVAPVAVYGNRDHPLGHP